MSDHLIIRDLTLTYPGGDGPAIEDVSLEVAEGEVLALIGGSGSGKSTLLRAIAGLERPGAGRVELAGRILTAPGALIPPEQRRVGMVSQSGDLFPHLSVLRNVTYALRKRVPRPQRRQRALELLDLVGLADYGNRFPAELSGGEAQRVALARALGFHPSLLLLDEPFSNLDAGLRDRLRTLTLDLLRRENITAIFVTHHGDDALSAGDRLAVLHQGHLIQTGTPRDVWKDPAGPEVAALFGSVNLLPHPESDLLLCLRADQLRLCPENDACLATGHIERVDFLGSCQLVTLRVPDSEHPVHIRIPADQDVAPGSTHGIERAPE